MMEGVGFMASYKFIKLQENRTKFFEKISENCADGGRRGILLINFAFLILFCNFLMELKFKNKNLLDF